MASLISPRQDLNKCSQESRPINSFKTSTKKTEIKGKILKLDEEK